ncbi:hypothetical protein [Spirosoma sordidisoli]|uniref:Uncharacterized protein n=1 Tax=Spirosoma sordidisoli TaxID=2502893 RepID=A0A4Q2UEG9_9BACT|nr:hypothetical protein [Spirosoma sordidisoli]RYC67384.1 hypothetical protein EQG79_25050 [Spirosoma sordidisoli]
MDDNSTLKLLDFWVNFSANFLTIVASGIAIYVFIKSKDKLASALNAIVNYSIQLTLSDLKYKVERLNDYTTNDKDQLQEVIGILHEIEGQIIGSKSLEAALSEQLAKISNFTNNPRLLSEPKKRSLVAELREKIRHIDVSNYGKIIN